MFRTRSLALLAAVTSVAAMLTGVAHASAGSPPPVRHLAAYVAHGSISVRWTNPNRASFSRVVVRYARGTKAPARDRGKAVVLNRPRSRSVVLPGLAKDTAYAVSVWTRQAGHWSKRATTAFTTDAPPDGNGHYVGRVTDTNGSPLRGADVIAQSFDTGLERSTRTAPDGTFDLDLAAGADYVVTVAGSNATGGNSDATGYQSFGDDISVGAGHRTSAGHIALHPGALVSGRVVDAAGQPVAGIRPYAAPALPYVDETGVSVFYDFGPDAPQAVTGADGRFELKGLPNDSLQVCFDPVAQRDPASTADKYLARCNLRTLEPVPGSSTTIPDTTVDSAPAGTIAGTVRAPSGRGAGYVEVDAERISGGFNFGETFASAHGRYQLKGLKPGRYEICVHVFSGAQPSRAGLIGRCLAKPVTVRAAQTTAKDVILPSGGGVTGKITTRTGKPLADVAVELSYRKQHRGDFGSAITDGRGHYTVSGLGGGTYRVCLRPSSQPQPGSPTGAAGRCLQRKVTVARGEVRTGIDAALAAGGAISGVVTDAEGHPVRYVYVSANGLRGNRSKGYSSTDAAGRYEIAGLSPGDYRICFEDLQLGVGENRTCTTTAVHTRAVTGHVDGQLAARASIDVTVRDGDGHRVAGVDVVVLRRCADSGFGCSRTPLFSATKDVAIVDSWVTNPAGQVSFDELRPGDYAVCLFAFYGATPTDTPATGYADKCTGSDFTLHLRRGKTRSLTETLSVGGAVTGRVTDASGQPLRGVRVHVSGSAADDYHNDGSSGGVNYPTEYSVTGSDGTFTVRSVTPGDQTVCLRATHARSAGTSTRFFDQCVGGPPDSHTGGAPVSIVAGQTADLGDIALQAKPTG